MTIVKKNKFSWFKWWENSVVDSTKLFDNDAKVVASEEKSQPDSNSPQKTNSFVKEQCSIDPKTRSHFVVHCTAGNMSLAAIKKHTRYDSKNKSRSKAHVYVMKDGSTLEIWPFTEKNVWATKLESKKGLKGRMFHVELNYGPPDAPTNEQYETLADLYLDASNTESCWPIIVPHIEVDRGLPNGHKDPTDFNYNKFYSILKEKGVPIDKISKFDHDRYWGNKSYKVPWGSDKSSWPPILSGNPHK